MEKIAKSTSWNNIPIDKPIQLKISLKFNDEQFSKLIKGLIPREMEDKWFIYFENDWLYFHRSWTGFGVYKALLIKEQDSYYIKYFWAERNQEKYKNQDEKVDVETFSFLIARGLLEEDVDKIHFNRNINSDEDIIKGWSNFGNLL
ncbi:hypothetical protein [Mucilaginibacter arboris]|uniref:Uncharacterized protein n=1 Tax=Mucilaginibacter arboris TaxID=2682090 RepID=A0A7K1SZ14_9SPHI|nr:hypothetical protein [Mucilaginibacter arboris]MVN22555.1 hypothetical protein [Mucilaginibacter arboris]